MPSKPIDSDELGELIRRLIDAGLYTEDSCIGHGPGEKKLKIDFLIPQDPVERLRLFDCLRRLLTVSNTVLVARRASSIGFELSYTRPSTVSKSIKSLCEVIPEGRV